MKQPQPGSGVAQRKKRREAPASSGQPRERPKKVTRVGLLTNVPIIQYGFAQLLAQTEDLVLAGAGEEEVFFREVPQSESPDLILVDIDTGVEIETVLRLFRELPACRIILWSRTTVPHMTARAIEAGVRGILVMTHDNDLLLKCLRKVAQGELWFGKALTQVLLSKRSTALSTRERQLVAALNAGLSNKETAACLGIAEGSVKVYLSRLYRKLGVRDRLELVLYSIRHKDDFRAEVERLRARGRYLGLTARDQDAVEPQTQFQQ